MKIRRLSIGRNKLGVVEKSSIHSGENMDRKTIQLYPIEFGERCTEAEIVYWAGIFDRTHSPKVATFVCVSEGKPTAIVETLDGTTPEIIHKQCQYIPTQTFLQQRSRTFSLAKES